MSSPSLCSGDVPKRHGSGHSQAQRSRLAPTSGGRQGHGAPQGLLGDGLDELQHAFGLQDVTEPVGIANRLAASCSRC